MVLLYAMWQHFSVCIAMIFWIYTLSMDVTIFLIAMHFWIYALSMDVTIFLSGQMVGDQIVGFLIAFEVVIGKCRERTLSCTTVGFLCICRDEV